MIREGAGDNIPILEVILVSEGLKQSPANDLEPLFGACRPPRGLHPANHVPEAVQGFAATLATDLNVVRLGVRGAHGV